MGHGICHRDWTEGAQRAGHTCSAASVKGLLEEMGVGAPRSVEGPSRAKRQRKGELAPSA